MERKILLILLLEIIFAYSNGASLYLKSRDTPITSHGNHSSIFVDVPEDLYLEIPPSAPAEFLSVIEGECGKERVNKLAVPRGFYSTKPDWLPETESWSDDQVQPEDGGEDPSGLFGSSVFSQPSTGDSEPVYRFVGSSIIRSTRNHPTTYDRPSSTRFTSIGSSRFPTTRNQYGTTESIGRSYDPSASGPSASSLREAASSRYASNPLVLARQHGSKPPVHQSQNTFAPRVMAQMMRGECRPQSSSRSTVASVGNFISETTERCRNDGCIGGKKTTWLLDMDFYHTRPILDGPSPTWRHVSLAGYTSDDGILVTGKLGGFLDSNRFTKSAGQTVVPELDHLKWLAFATKKAPIPKGGRLVVEWKASAQTFGTARNPFGQQLTQPNDPRLASAGFITNDPETGTSFSFLLTNDRVYVWYTRQPYLRLITGSPFAAFSYIIPVKVRAKDDVHRLGVEFNGKTEEVSWYVDFRQVFSIQTVGYPLRYRTYMTEDHGGFGERVFPRSIEHGFGTFTLLDHYPVCHRPDSQSPCTFPPITLALLNLGDGTEPFPQYNPVLGQPHKATYFDPDAQPSNRLWGQGAESRIFQLSVFQVTDCDEPC